jgi:hypothetical protein
LESSCQPGKDKCSSVPIFLIFVIFSIPNELA